MSTHRIVHLGANQISPRPYRGGTGIARLRGTDHTDPYTPEDFVASATEVYHGNGMGLSVLPNGTLLRDALKLDAEGFLGADHALRWGANPQLLTKLLSTDERLFIHAHPDDAFAAQHLSAACGKTESWLIVDTEATDGSAFVLLGFQRDVSAEELRDWHERQDTDAMMTAMNRLSVAPGDTVHVPAGVPHGIGPGITLVELQQPADLSLLLEFAGYPGLSRGSALLGLPVEVALNAFRRVAVAASELATWRSTRGREGRVERLLPAEADPFYRAWRIHAGADALRLSPGYSVIVVLNGSGQVRAEGVSHDVHRGHTLLIRHDAGEVVVDAGLDVVRCAPPEARL